MKKFFLIRSSVCSNLMTDTETIFPKEVQQGCWLGCVPTKFPSSIDAFILLSKILEFVFSFFLTSFILELLYQLRNLWFRELYEGSVGYVLGQK